MSIHGSQAAWKAMPQKSFRTERVRKQRSTMFKLAAALAEPDEPGLRPLPRGQFTFRHPMMYCAWAFLFAYFAGCMFYMAFWVLTRSEVQAQLLNSTDPYDNGTVLTNEDISDATDGILSIWLQSAAFAILFTYLVTEPALVMIRFILLPSCLRRFGASIDRQREQPRALGRLASTVTGALSTSDNKQQDIEIGGAAMAAHKTTRWEQVTHDIFDFVSDLINIVVP